MYGYVNQPAYPPAGSAFPNELGLNELDAVLAEAERNIKAPKPLIVMSALTALSLSLQGVVNVKKPTGHSVPTSLMLLAIADSGERKSTTENLFMRAIKDFQASHQIRYQEDIRLWELENEIWLEARKDALKEAASLKRKGGDITAALERLRVLEDEKPHKPRQVKMLYEDSTSEALFHGMYSNMESAGLISSEGGEILSGRAFSDLAKQNALWSGDPVTVDRKQADSYVLTGARLTVSIMAQNSAFDEYMNKAGDRSRGSGLWARFLVCKPWSTQGYRLEYGGEPEREHQQKFYDKITEFLSLGVDESRMGVGEKVTVSLCKDAEAFWIGLANHIEIEMREGGRFCRIKDHASKLADNIARVAALFHCYEYGIGGSISVDTLASAMRLCFYFSDCFRSIFDPRYRAWRDAEELNIWFNSFRIRGVRYVRKNMVLKYGPNKLRKKSELDTALASLSGAGLVRMFRVSNINSIDLSPMEPYDSRRISREIRRREPGFNVVTGH